MVIVQMYGMIGKQSLQISSHGQIIKTCHFPNNLKFNNNQRWHWSRSQASGEFIKLPLMFTNHVFSDQGAGIRTTDPNWFFIERVTDDTFLINN